MGPLDMPEEAFGVALLAFDERSFYYLTSFPSYDVISYIMDIQQVVADTKYNIRTQISLSASLYHILKQRASDEDVSLAEYIRRNLIAHFKEEKEKEGKKKERIMELIEKVRKIRESGNSGWTEVKNPYKLIRKWRQEDDEKREEMIKKKVEAYGRT